MVVHRIDVAEIAERHPDWARLMAIAGGCTWPVDLAMMIWARRELARLNIMITAEAIEAAVLELTGPRVQR